MGTESTAEENKKSISEKGRIKRNRSDTYKGRFLCF